ncbi:MAG TPA: CehA/McbA family metallohydrolase [Ktedonobacteraceae bacterium]|nr:CehA/McbA family metallohydrolase [Ktedonobacteraceae bacterium]
MDDGYSGNSSLLSPSGYSRADVHMHTNLSDGWASPAQVIEVAKQLGLRVIAITDHDHIEGAKRVADLLAEREEPVQMITGVEMTTRSGHLIGLFIQKAPKSLRPVEETIDAIKEQGGLVIVPHPFGRLVPSLSRAKIEELLSKGYVIDGIEMYNPSPANAKMRAEVRNANQEWKLAELGGSDAHFWQHIGAAYTLFPGQSPENLRQGILERTVRAGGQEVPPTRLSPATYIAQCAWSWFVDPPRRIMRSLKERV